MANKGFIKSLGLGVLLGLTVGVLGLTKPSEGRFIVSQDAQRLSAQIYDQLVNAGVASSSTQDKWKAIEIMGSRLTEEGYVCR